MTKVEVIIKILKLPKNVLIPFFTPGLLYGDEPKTIYTFEVNYI
jgi:hypothetical protein